MTTLQDIERAAQAYADARVVLATHVQALHDEMEQAKRARLAAIRRAVARAAEKQAELQALVADSRELFAKPKTRVLHGVKVGYAKQPGAIEIADEAATLTRIHKMFAGDEEMLQQLIKTTEKPIKDALGELAADKLKKLGVAVTNDSEKVVIKPADSEVDKIVDALLKGATEGDE